MFTEYSELDMTGKLMWQFRSIGRALRDMSGGRASQKRILTVLLKSGGVTQTALAEHLGIQPGSASEILSKMEAADLISRQANEDDRRMVDVELTEEGRRQALVATEESELCHARMFSGMTGEEQAQLLILLEKMVLPCREDCCGRREGRAT